MKRIITAICLFISLSSFAQIDILSAKPKYNEAFFKKYMPVQKMNLLVFPKATLSGRTDLGRIYSLPVDNMPCFVPDINLLKPIPNAGVKGFQYSLMLNPFKKDDLIPIE